MATRRGGGAITRRLAGLFQPAAALLGRLRYAQKFAVVGLVLLVPLWFVSAAYISLKRDQIDFSAKERHGVALMVPLVDLTAELTRARREAAVGAPITADVDAHVNRVDGLDARIGPILHTVTAWQATRKLVLEAQRTTSPSPDLRRRAYDTAVDALRDLIVKVGDESNLTLDPDLDTYYLMDTLQFRLSALIDVAGRTAETAALAGDTGRATAIDLGLNHGVINDVSSALARAADAIVATTASESVRAGVLFRFDRLGLAAGSLTAALTAAAADAEFNAVASPASLVHHEAMTLAHWVGEALDGLLKARIAGFTSTATRVALGSSAAALLALYLFVGFYLSVARPIRRIVGALDAVAHGDLTSRVAVDTRDELGFVAHALNDTIARTEVATERLATRATHDALTGLPNRAYVLSRLTEALDRCCGDDLMCVLFIDLDRFKIINDSLGHGAGDEVLREIAARLSVINRSGDTVARLAGDEFVVICEGLESIDVAIRIAERIVGRVNEPLGIHVGPTLREVSVGASVGIAVADGSVRPEPADLLRDADVAMYQAKQRGRGRVEIFDEVLRVAVQHRLESRNQLRHGIEAGQIVAYYQPIVAVGTGQVVGFEALARWHHPTRGLLGAADFIDVAEESGLVLPLGVAVLRQACAQAAEWRAVRPDAGDLHIAVNVSGAQFADPMFVPTVAEVLRETRLDPNALWLEITETSLMADAASARETLVRVRELGVHLAVDDFGTGYSSLAYLRRFPVEALKIDRTFVLGMGDPEDDAIITMIVALARTLGMNVVAEGVETPEQLARLKELGCDLVQGFLFDRAAPAEKAWFGTTVTV